MSENRGVTAYHGIEVELAGPKADLLAAIREVGALMQTAGVKNTQVNEWVYRSLAALDSRRGSLGASSSKRPANSSRQTIAAPPRSAKARIGIIWRGVFAARSACSSSFRSLVTK